VKLKRVHPTGGFTENARMSGEFNLHIAVCRTASKTGARARTEGKTSCRPRHSLQEGGEKNFHWREGDDQERMVENSETARAEGEERGKVLKSLIEEGEP